MPFFVDSYALHDVDDTIVKWLVGTFEPNSTFRPHSHYRLEISMILSGEGEYWVKSGTLCCSITMSCIVCAIPAANRW